jgi:hypothetical protein
MNLLSIALVLFSLRQDVPETYHYSQETVHSSCATHYELREIASGRLADSMNIPAAPCGEGLARGRKIPKWVNEFISATKPR